MGALACVLTVGVFVFAPQTEATTTKTALKVETGSATKGLWLASYRTRERAEGGWTHLEGRFGDLLVGYVPRVRKVDLGKEKGTVFRLYADPTMDAAAAGAICRQLKQRGGDCIVVKAKRVAAKTPEPAPKVAAKPPVPAVAPKLPAAAPKLPAAAKVLPVAANVNFSELIGPTAEALFSEALDAQEHGRLHGAVALYSEAIDSGGLTREGLAAAYNNRGSCYSDLGDIRSAIADFNDAIATAPGYAVAHYNRGYAYARLEKYDLAETDFTMAIETRTDFAVAYNNRGNVFQKLGRSRQAIEDFTAAIGLDREYAEAYFNRSLAYEAEGNRMLALADLKTAYKLNPEHPVIRAKAEERQLSN